MDAHMDILIDTHLLSMLFHGAVLIFTLLFDVQSHELVANHVSKTTTKVYRAAHGAFASTKNGNSPSPHFCRLSRCQLEQRC